MSTPLPNHFHPVYAHAVGRPDVPPCGMPARFRTDIAYFLTPTDAGEAKLPLGEYKIDPANVQEWFNTGVLNLVSPLDATHATEVEISEDQERFVHWLRDHSVDRVRVE